jgi:hypothetical protein
MHGRGIVAAIEKIDPADDAIRPIDFLDPQLVWPSGGCSATVRC